MRVRWLTVVLSRSLRLSNLLISLHLLLTITLRLLLLFLLDKSALVLSWLWLLQLLLEHLLRCVVRLRVWCWMLLDHWFGLTLVVKYFLESLDKPAVDALVTRLRILLLKSTLTLTLYLFGQIMLTRLSPVVLMILGFTVVRKLSVDIRSWRIHYITLLLILLNHLLVQLELTLGLTLRLLRVLGLSNGVQQLVLVRFE